MYITVWLASKLIRGVFGRSGLVGSRGSMRNPWAPIVASLCGYCPDTVTVYTRATIESLIYPYYECHPTVTEWRQYPTNKVIPNRELQWSLWVVRHSSRRWSRSKGSGS